MASPVASFDDAAAMLMFIGREGHFGPGGYQTAYFWQGLGQLLSGLGQMMSQRGE